MLNIFANLQRQDNLKVRVDLQTDAENCILSVHLITANMQAYPRWSLR